MGSAKRPQLYMGFEEAKEVERKCSDKKKEHRSFVTALRALKVGRKYGNLPNRKSENLGKD